MIDSESGADSSVYIDVKVKKRTTYQLNAWIKTEGLKPLRGGRGAQLNLHALPDQAGKPLLLRHAKLHRHRGRHGH